MTARSHRSIRLRWPVVSLVALAGVAVTSRVVRRRRLAMGRVAEDLRSPVLYLPLSLESSRALRVLRSLPAPPIAVPTGVEVESRTIPTDDGHPLRVVLYERRDRSKPTGALVWIHGGGMVIGTPEQGNAMCGRWADELGILVVSVDYRLAPEEPFPAGLDDCYTALRWLHANADELGVDPARVAVGGDSAGGGLAAGLSQLARDRGGPAICFQLLVYPMLDDRTVLRTDHDGRGTFIWTPGSNRFGWTAYLGRPPTEDDARPYAAPARGEDLAGLPPAWIGVGDLDLFHDEDVEYAARLEAAGVPCDLYLEPGMYHGADAIRPGAPTSRAFRDRMTEALATRLHAQERA
jgi:acetyl esterase/lipase